MAIAAGIIIGWPSTVASIPSGWTRVSALDARHILAATVGADADLVTDRGSASHTHTSPSHTPVQDAHTHSSDTATATPSTILEGASPGSAPDSNHVHTTAVSNSIVGTNNGIAITVNANSSNDPPFQEVIWLQSSGTPTTIPTGALAFFDSDVLPTSWTRVLGDTYLKGAAVATDGGAVGGALTHTHTSPAHTHTQNLHSHTGVSGAADTVAFKGTGAAVVASLTHTHALTFVGTVATNQAVTTTITAASHEPPYRKLNTIQSSATTLPTNIVCLWGGTVTSIPTGWTRLTGQDGKFAKGCTADTQVGTTGGATTHSHTATDCQPIQDPHTHSVSGGPSSGTTTANAAGASVLTADGHTHATWTCTTDTATNQTTPVTITSATAGDAYPPHRTVIFIFFSGSAPSVLITGATTYDLIKANAEDIRNDDELNNVLRAAYRTRRRGEG